MATDRDDLADRPDRVLRDLSLLLSAARVSPILRDAVLRVEAEVTRLRAVELLAETPADEVERLRAQRDAALEIHRIYPAAPAAAPYCEECPSDLGWPCSTARALGAE